MTKAPPAAATHSPASSSDEAEVSWRKCDIDRRRCARCQFDFLEAFQLTCTAGRVAIRESSEFSDGATVPSAWIAPCLRVYDRELPTRPPVPPRACMSGPQWPAPFWARGPGASESPYPSLYRRWADTSVGATGIVSFS